MTNKKEVNEIMKKYNFSKLENKNFGILYIQYLLTKIFNEEAAVIIDGIIHHMYPFPVRRIDGTELELKNAELFDQIPKDLREMMTVSSNRGFCLKHYSLCPSKFI